MDKVWPALDIHVPGCDPQLQELVLAELDDFQPTAIQESDDGSRLRAFFSSVESRNAASLALATAFAAHLFVESVDISDEDWAARSQAQLRAVTVGQLIIAPPWDLPENGVRPRECLEQGVRPLERGLTPLTIIIRPSMGFGTGHHATTRLALRALQSIPIAGLTVLDVGCGSGILAIAAVRLGARSAVGIDIDPDALSSARDNLELNAATDAVRFEETDFRDRSSPAQVVLANLTGGLLERSASKLGELVEPGGFLIASGFMEGETAVVPALEQFLSLETLDREDEWLCAVYKSRQA